MCLGSTLRLTPEDAEAVTDVFPDSQVSLYDGCLMKIVLEDVSLEIKILTIVPLSCSIRHRGERVEALETSLQSVAVHDDEDFSIYDWIAPLLEIYETATHLESEKETLCQEEKAREGERQATVQEEREREREEERKRVFNFDRGSIVRGPDLVDRKSRFYAHVARVTSYDEAKAFFNYLRYTDKRIETATHNMHAWRYKDRDTLKICADYDDDGEAGAGAKMLFLLNRQERDDVCVVVTRHFGGILLGPSRFKRISETSLAALAVYDAECAKRSTSKQRK
ncbi:impact family protein [Kipferlia bialata]|uniref:Impact family protein n=1 Tax=Kipferlia bialata TaxID=797122 RepID=A0A9K3D2X5_9EUKA|nr:impact family protein [Kipferlia bialata]|eukprot:g8803.t1